VGIIHGWNGRPGGRFSKSSVRGSWRDFGQMNRVMLTLGNVRLDGDTVMLGDTGRMVDNEALVPASEASG
jgi:hypothetical protein